MRNDFLTRKECTAMRGIAILAIMLHNYCHFNGKIVQENEYNFLSTNNDRLWEVLTHPDTLLPVHLLSFFGHYGVPVFLFLSGFGLIMKYEREPTSPRGPFSFMRYHYLKLLRMLIVGFSLFIMVDVLIPGSFTYHWDNVVAQLLMVINVLPQPNHIIWPGIYWFFGLMLELYAIYRLLFYRRHSWYVVAAIVLCLAVQLFFNPEGERLLRLHYNFVGSMLPFGAGILAGRYADRLGVSLSQWQWAVVVVVASALIFVMGFHFLSWLWIPLVIIVGTIALVKTLPRWLLTVLMWFGGISAAMFVAHPIARRLFIRIAWKGDVYDGLMLYVIAAIALSWVVKKLIEQIPQPKQNP